MHHYHLIFLENNITQKQKIINELNKFLDIYEKLFSRIKNHIFIIMDNFFTKNFIYLNFILSLTLILISK